MLQDPNVERVIKNYTEPLQKQISIMQIELETLKIEIMEEYAKQQAIKFSVFVSNYYGDKISSKGKYDELYDKFKEQ